MPKDEIKIKYELETNNKVPTKIIQMGDSETAVWLDGKDDESVFIDHNIFRKYPNGETHKVQYGIVELPVEKIDALIECLQWAKKQKGMHDES